MGRQADSDAHHKAESGSDYATRSLADILRNVGKTANPITHSQQYGLASKYERRENDNKIEAQIRALDRLALKDALRHVDLAKAQKFIAEHKKPSADYRHPNRRQEADETGFTRRQLSDEDMDLLVNRILASTTLQRRDGLLFRCDVYGDCSPPRHHRRDAEDGSEDDEANSTLGDDNAPSEELDRRLVGPEKYRLAKAALLAKNSKRELEMDKYETSHRHQGADETEVARRQLNTKFLGPFIDDVLTSTKLQRRGEFGIFKNGLLSAKPTSKYFSNCDIYGNCPPPRHHRRNFQDDPEDDEADDADAAPDGINSEMIGRSVDDKLRQYIYGYTGSRLRSRATVGEDPLVQERLDRRLFGGLGGYIWRKAKHGSAVYSNPNRLSKAHLAEIAERNFDAGDDLEDDEANDANATADEFNSKVDRRFIGKLLEKYADGHTGSPLSIRAAVAKESLPQEKLDRRIIGGLGGALGGGGSGKKSQRKPKQESASSSNTKPLSKAELAEIAQGLDSDDPSKAQRHINEVLRHSQSHQLEDQSGTFGSFDHRPSHGSSEADEDEDEPSLNLDRRSRPRRKGNRKILEFFSYREHPISNDMNELNRRFIGKLLAGYPENRIYPRQNDEDILGKFAGDDDSKDIFWW
jgi:hypothetical protein